MALVRWLYASLAIQVWSMPGLALPQPANASQPETNVSALPWLDDSHLSTDETLMAACNPIIALGLASSILGLIASSEGLTASTISLLGMFMEEEPKNHAMVRVVAGKGRRDQETEGRPPSIVLFESRGKRVG